MYHIKLAQSFEICVDFSQNIFLGPRYETFRKDNRNCFLFWLNRNSKVLGTRADSDLLKFDSELFDRSRNFYSERF